MTTVVDSAINAADALLPALPYEAIGKAVVAIALIVLAIVAVLVVALACLFIWVRGFTRISNKMYEGYDTHPEEARPPAWRLKISAIAIGFANFQFTKIPSVYRKSADLTENNTTFRESVVDYLTGFGNTPDSESTDGDDVIDYDF